MSKFQYERTDFRCAECGANLVEWFNLIMIGDTPVAKVHSGEGWQCPECRTKYPFPPNQ